MYWTISDKTGRFNSDSYTTFLARQLEKEMCPIIEILSISPRDHSYIHY